MEIARPKKAHRTAKKSQIPRAKTKECRTRNHSNGVLDIPFFSVLQTLQSFHSSFLIPHSLIISCTPTSDFELFTGWSTSGRATSGWKSPSHLVLITENMNLRCGSATNGLRYRVPGLRGLRYKTISRTPTSDFKSFTGWIISGRATSGRKSPSHLVLIAENMNLRCGRATKGLSAFRVQRSAFLVLKVSGTSQLVALPLLILNYLRVDQQVGGRHLVETRSKR